MDKVLRQQHRVALLLPEVGEREKKAVAATLDLCAVEYKFNSRNQQVLEEKQATKDRLGLSPDIGDALTLTFAKPVA